PPPGRGSASRALAHRRRALARPKLARRNLECKRRARVVVPDLGGIDAMPMRAFAQRQKEIDRSRGRAGTVCDGAAIAEAFAEMSAFRMWREAEQVDHVGGRKCPHGQSRAVNPTASL